MAYSNSYITWVDFHPLYTTNLPRLLVNNSFSDRDRPVILGAKKLVPLGIDSQHFGDLKNNTNAQR